MLDVKATDLRSCFILSTIACGLITLSASAALAALNCNEYFHNPDGSWSPTHPIVIVGLTGQRTVMPGDKFCQNMLGLYGRIASSLNASCRSERRFVGPRNIPRMP
jgi:hypothetical protein